MPGMYRNYQQLGLCLECGFAHYFVGLCLIQPLFAKSAEKASKSSKNQDALACPACWKQFQQLGTGIVLLLLLNLLPAHPYRGLSAICP